MKKIFVLTIVMLFIASTAVFGMEKPTKLISITNCGYGVIANSNSSNPNSKHKKPTKKAPQKHIQSQRKFKITKNKGYGVLANLESKKTK